MRKIKKQTIICPVCGKHIFRVAEDSHETCPVCGWIYDDFQMKYKFAARGTNKFSLAQQQKAWRILNGEREIGYGTDNLLWGIAFCDLYHDHICIDECKQHVNELAKGKTLKGVTDIQQAQKVCAHCIARQHKSLVDMRKRTKMVDIPNTDDTYGNGQEGIGTWEYDIEEYQDLLKSLIKYCHEEAAKKEKLENNEPDPDFNTDQEYLQKLFNEDEQGRRNFDSYFYRPVLSMADFINYASDSNGNLDYRFNLSPFGYYYYKTDFDPDEKQVIAQILHLSLSFYNYKCDQFALAGLYYLDNIFEGWDINDFDDTIAAWFADIGDDLDEDNLKWFVTETLRESLAYKHVNLALHLLSYLGYAKTDPELKKLVKMFGRVPAFSDVCTKCL